MGKYFIAALFVSMIIGYNIGTNVEPYWLAMILSFVQGFICGTIGLIADSR